MKSSGGFCPDLLLDEGHDADPSQDRLPTQALPRDAVGERLGAVGHWLAQVTHEERHVRPGEDREEERGVVGGGAYLHIYTFTLYRLSVCHLLELLLSFAPEVSDQPLRGESVLGRHPPAHHCVQESLPLACVEAQHLLTEMTMFYGFS